MLLLPSELSLSPGLVFFFLNLKRLPKHVTLNVPRAYSRSTARSKSVLEISSLGTSPELGLLDEELSLRYPKP